ncbi:MAG: sigma 54-interacting transcriptional regulator [Deltaproteobacteria bacterium]|jgi:PAS domain S-box-containing protein|nr:sigma 54-interacting transcriptional regulator [Deltaproteobacteria bacterium]MBW2532818.1 sigma 54-interacting transcriptional regulator [Deltaproteobacteria bacterium]
MKPEYDKRFLETILSSVADGVFTVDRQWRITSFNRAAERITGVDAQEALGKRCSDVFHADICEKDCALRKTLDTGQQLIDQHATILNRRGAATPISLSTAVLRDPSGQLLGAVETFRDLSAIEQLRREIHSRYTFEDIVGRSQAFQKIFAILPDVAESDATVLIEGPSGSGKELIARAVHNLSSRRKQPYVVVNCGTLPPNLFESELFGYVAGAFTDAKRDKPGRIALAEGGTIVFDEVSELPMATQVKLLRMLQEREYEPLGGVKTLKANVRVVAATNQNLLELVSQGRFRDDLYFRLGVVRLAVPPLSQRREDIPYLVEHFIGRFNAKRGKKICGVTPAVMELLMRCELPGNVRQLENIIEYAFVLCHNSMIDVAHLPEEVQTQAQSQHTPPPATVGSKLKWAEAEAIRATLARRGGALGKTARELGISRTTLWRKMKRFQIDAEDFRQR